MEILVSVGSKVAEYTVLPIGRQVGYVIFYKRNFKELEDDVMELEVARDTVNHSIEDERRSGRVIETDVQNWLEKVNEVIVEAKKLQEDPGRAKVGCSRWSFPNLFLRHQLSRKATKIANKVVEVQGKGRFYRLGYLPVLGGVCSSSVRRDVIKLKTRETIKHDIMLALKNPKVCNIGVYGMGGVGKSTLVKEVAQIARQDKLFDAVVMANVSKIPDFKTIQGEIADLLGLRFDEETITGRAKRLQHRIKVESTILVILDDLWQRLDLENVGIPSADQHNGCKLLMTSRNKDVLEAMDAQKDFRLDVLNDADTWSLFCSMAGDEVKRPDLHNVAVQVAKKCAGLPLRIATVARYLKSKDIYAWEDALKQLGSYDHAGVDAETFSALELSYKGLESDEMKPIFLLSAVVYTGDSVEYFLNVAMGLDIFKDINTVKDARNRLHKIIGSLKSSCLLLEGDTNNRIQMHDIVREFATTIAYRDHHVIVRKKEGPPMEWSGKDYLKNCTQIILNKCQIQELPKRLDCPKLKLFILDSANRSLEIPDTLFEGMGSLKVLDLRFLNSSSLPTSFSSLTDLQTLCLDHCVLGNTDAIGFLKNLKILRICYSSMMTKLSSEIEKLTSLKVLDLSHSGVEVIPPNIISGLTKLEELYMSNASVKWEVQNSEQNENASLAELQQLSNLTALEIQISEAWILPRELIFDKLERYKIVIGDVWEWRDIKYSTLNTLMLKLSTSIHLEHGIKPLIKKVKSLYLDEVDGISNVLYQLNGEGFPFLKHLHVQNNERIKYIVDSMERNQVKIVFLNMETLILHNLKNMEKICHGQLAVNSFGKLRVIKVQHCVQLKYLLSVSMVKGLSQLFEIEVCQCNSMKKIVLGDSNASADEDATNMITFPSLRSLTLQHLQTLDNFFSHELSSSIIERKYQMGETYVPAPFFSAQVAFPNLDTLKLSSLNLTKIWDDNQHSIFNLTNLIVENCGGLKCLFSSNVVGSFTNLKRLEISQCQLMDEIIATEERNDGIIESKEVRFSKLETIILKDMENLKTTWHYEFDAVKALQVINCDKITVIFPSSMQKTYLNLESLEIKDCASLEEIFEVFPNEKNSIIDTMQVKEITIVGLQKLQRIWSMDPQGILSFHNLENVILENCESLEYLFPFSVATHCSNLKVLCIMSCKNMKEIVAKEGSMCTNPIFEFSQLKKLLLWNSHNLEGFYTGNYTLASPSLRDIDVSNCVKFERI